MAECRQRGRLEFRGTNSPTITTLQGMAVGRVCPQKRMVPNPQSSHARGPLWSPPPLPRFGLWPFKSVWATDTWVCSNQELHQVFVLF